MAHFYTGDAESADKVAEKLGDLSVKDKASEEKKEENKKSEKKEDEKKEVKAEKN